MKRKLLKSVLALSAVALLALLTYLSFTPLPATLQQQPFSKVLLSNDDQLLAATIAADQQWRFPAPEQLPAKYVTALLAFEDRRFYWHPGIDPIAIARAARSNYHAGRIVSGGSTLTMQLARMLRQDPPRTLTNKISEALLALTLEWRFSKDQLLIHYATHAPYGGNLVGLNTASWRYFNRAAQQLSWAEAALLAVLPNSPALIHLERNRATLKQKRDTLLEYLHRQQALSENDLKLALLEPLPTGVKPVTRFASHLLQTVSQRFTQHNMWRTTLDATLQKKAQRVAQLHGRRLASNGVNNLAIVIMDNRDRTLQAYIGNHSDQGVAHQVDIAQRPRSTGSILKPLLYAAMLESGELLPNTLVADIPSHYNGFTPENYDREFRGAVPAKLALARSLNIPAVRMLQQYGIPRFHADLEQLGLSSLFRPANDYGLSLILGGAEASLYEITAVYAQLMSRARGEINNAETTRAPHPIAWHNDRRQPLSGTGSGSNIFSQGSAWLTVEALLDVSRPGVDNHWRQFSSSQSIAWKTGTSYGLRDAWAVGSNNRYTIGVWAGNAGGEGVAGLSGLNSAAPVLFEMFDRLPKTDWPKAPLHALKAVKTCVDDGYLAGDGCTSETSWAPRHSHFQTLTPYHTSIQLDAAKRFRVHGKCESVAHSTRQHWLVLPPLIEQYWIKYHPEYRSLPPWRPDCVADLNQLESDMPMAIVYPNEGSRIYIPKELNGQRGRTIFKATHKQNNAKIHWHIDDQYLQTSSLFHETAVDIKPGWHRLVLVDELGFRLERWFNVISR